MRPNPEKKNLLLVEDDVIVAMDAVDSMEPLNMSVQVATNVQAALEALQAGAIDAAVVDFDLGGESSTPVIEQLVRNNTPLVLVSGTDKNELEAVGNRVGKVLEIYEKPADYKRIALRLIS